MSAYYSPLRLILVLSIPHQNSPLIAGNLFTFFASPKIRLSLSLTKKEEVSPDTYQLTFSHPAPFAYTPGQYLEWTFDHATPDNRGIRRYFTIASAPHEPLSIGIKIKEKASSFKEAIKKIVPGEKIITGGLYGDFILHPNQTQKLVWIAGGIGITPFRSMAKHLLKTNEQRNITLFYCALNPNDFPYLDIFQEAKKIGLTTIPVITDKANIPENWTGEAGYLTPEIIKKHIPDFNERHYYLSGPNAMVTSYKSLLKNIGISSSQIHTDYFPGF